MLATHDVAPRVVDDLLWALTEKSNDDRGVIGGAVLTEDAIRRYVVGQIEKPRSLGAPRDRIKNPCRHRPPRMKRGVAAIARLKGDVPTARDREAIGRTG